MIAFHERNPMRRILALTVFGVAFSTALGEDKPLSVEQIAESARKSVVVITTTGREGKKTGVGTGFVVSTDGLIATNLHVIDEGRPITVELADGTRHEVTAIHASDRPLDLAIVRVATKDLKPLELGDSEKLKDGQAVVALGNPLGFKHSVVSGVLSARREFEGKPMLQIAIPVEPGNSGGPVVDMHGRVQGVLSIKSLVTANLGFAVPVNALKLLLAKPNPIPMERWLTIGALDTDEWKTLFGARWRQRAGRIMVEGMGTGFGGRSLCLSKRSVPDVPFEVAVTVKLDDESGAAGLVFHADGENKHYGFYPTGGKLRFVRFEGPDVFTWKILEEKQTPQYHPGEWNTIKVRVEKERIFCYVNDQQVIESNDTGLSSGQVGLAKFRDTRAEFKGFRLAKQIPPSAPPAALAQRVTKAVEAIAADGPPKPELVDKLTSDAPASLAVLRERAKMLEKQASQLRDLALGVHQQRVNAELAKLLQAKEDDIDLFHAALLIARLDNEELDMDVYRKEVERMAKDVQATLPKDADEASRLAALRKYLFELRGFHGSRNDYYNRANSYLNEVLDDREGLPITLSVLYLDLSRRLGLKVVGVGLPGHFVVKHVPAKGEPQLIDVYEGAKPMSREEASKLVEAYTGKPLHDEQLAAVSKKAILVRMLHNLLRFPREERDAKGMLRYLDTILTITPDAAEERWMRALLRNNVGNKQGARADAAWLLEHRPTGMDLERVEEFRRFLDRP
jgi:regulator of sirC expression with transglutaminase-like and TPR domain